MGTFSWQMASSTLERLATSRGTTQPSPGARVAAPPRRRAPSTGCKVRPCHRAWWAGPGALGDGGHCPQWGLRTEPRLFGVPGLTLRPLLAPTDPAFVASAHVPESLGSSRGDDDKIYFFFSETGKEFEFFENTIVSRVARICKVRGWASQSPPKTPRVQSQETPGGLRFCEPLLLSRKNGLANGFSLLLSQNTSHCFLLCKKCELQNRKVCADIIRQRGGVA